MVITYNPSHSNINSEVNAPFKMLSLMLRFLDNETKPTNKRPLRQPIEDYDEDDPAAAARALANPNSAFGAFAMPRQAEPDLAVDSGARMDTYNDDEESDYGDDDDDEGARRGFGELADEDKLSVNLDDVVDDESDEDAIDLNKKSAATGAASQDSTAVVENEETKEGSSSSRSGDSGENKSTGGSSGSGGAASTGNMFAVGESTDKGLADMETGSEVYMSELLVSISLLVNRDYFVL